jgi:hypothetical protein
VCQVIALRNQFTHGRHLLGPLAALEQVTKARNGALVRQSLVPCDLREGARERQVSRLRTCGSASASRSAQSSARSICATNSFLHVGFVLRFGSRSACFIVQKVVRRFREPWPSFV